MRLAIDATPVVPGRKGLGVVIEGFLDEMAPRPQSRSWIAYVDRMYANEARRRWPSMDVRPVRSRPSVLWELVILPRRARRDGARLVFTGRDRTLCEPRLGTALYLFEVPDYRTKSVLDGDATLLTKLVAMYSLGRFRTVAARVSHFIVSSQATGNALRERYRVPGDRIHVVYPGIHGRFRPPVDDGARQAARNRFCQGGPYVLHFATGDPRENTRVALASFATAVSNAWKGGVLLLAGVRASDLAALKTQAQELGIGQRTFFLGHVDGETLLTVYHGAEAYLDPTLYEGFGLQLVEAMACGVPVISSNVTSVPEVVGDAGLLFSPLDEKGFADALVRVLSDPDLQADLIGRGVARAVRYTWPDAAARIMGLLEKFSRGSDSRSEPENLGRGAG